MIFPLTVRAKLSCKTKRQAFSNELPRCNQAGITLNQFKRVWVEIELTFWQPNHCLPVHPLSRCCLLVFIGLHGVLSPARAQTEAEHRATWAKLQRQPLTEVTFRQSCDLIQTIGQTNLAVAYDLLAHYVPTVQKTGTRRWTHILLINWGKGYESLNRLAEAEPIFRQARQNAAPDANLYADALTYTVQLYTDWDKPDSVDRYLALGERIARLANDHENGSLIRTFRALSRMRKGQPDAMRADFDEAIRLATGLPDKNALFMARFNRATHYLGNPEQQIRAYDSLLTLTTDSSLIRKPRFYERTTVYFRNPRPTVLYNLVQLNLLLTDYDNAGKFADLVFDALVRPNPQAPFVPFIYAEMSFVKSYQGKFAQARALLDSSRRGFGGTETAIPYTTYFLAAGRLAEQAGQLGKAADYYRQSLTKGVTAGAFSRVPPEVFYARALLHTGQPDKARQVLAPLAKDAAANRFSAVGLYYFETLAGLRKAEGDLPGYSLALDTYHAIHDSLTSLNQYRAVQQIMTRVRMRDKEQQITRLNAENTLRADQLRRERRYYGIILALAGLTIALLVVYLQNRQARTRQRDVLQQSRSTQLEQQRKLELMENVMQAEDNERRRIADQLHDEVNPMLAIATLNVSSVLAHETTTSPTGQKLRRTQDALTTVSASVRGISHRLTPLFIERYGFRGAIEDLARSINLSERLRLDVLVIGFEQPGTYPLTTLNDLYRIIQELVHNILKHAEATHATVEVVEHEPPHLTIMVDDNGVGIRADTLTDGMGLSTIRAKVAYLNGQMAIERKPEGGTLIVIDL